MDRITSRFAYVLDTRTDVSRRLGRIRDRVTLRWRLGTDESRSPRYDLAAGWVWACRYTSVEGEDWQKDEHGYHFSRP